MSTENQEDQPTGLGPAGGDPVLSAGMGIAMRWGEVLDPEKLEIALKALEPQLRREYRERMKRLEMQEATAVRQAEERREERKHRRHMAGLVVGGVVAVAMLGAGVFVAKDAWWLATLLCGPSLLALAKVFVLRKSDAGDMSSVGRASRLSTNAAGQAQPPPPPPPVV